MLLLMTASQKIIADIEAEAGEIEIAEKELASFTQDLSVFARTSVPTRRVILGLFILLIWFKEVG